MWKWTDQKGIGFRCVFHLGVEGVMGGGVKVAVCYIHGGLAGPRESANGERKMPILYTCTFSFVLIASTSKKSSSSSSLPYEEEPQGQKREKLEKQQT